MTFKEAFEQMDKVEPPKQGIRVTRLECVKPDWKRCLMQQEELKVKSL